MKPKVFISIATSEIGGPGKGLLQFFHFGGSETCDPVIVSFWKGNSGEKKGEFDAAIKKTRLPYEILNQRAVYDIFLIPQALSIYNKYKPDVLQSHGYKSHVICFFLKIITGTPWIAFFHGWILGGVKIKIYKALDKFLFGFADKVVAVSEGMVKGFNLKWISKEKIHIIYNAVDPGEYSLVASNNNIREQYGIKSKAPLVAVVGRFSEEKGHRYFVEALPRIIRDFPNLKVMFIGDGPLKEDIQRMVNDLELKSYVIFTGYQNNVQEYYREIDLLVLPSLSEGMPNVALEAMLFGTPVLATRVGGIPEVVLDGKTGIIIDPKDPKQLAIALVRMLKNPETLRYFGEMGKMRVINEFNPAHRTKKILDLYNNVLSVKDK